MLKVAMQEDGEDFDRRISTFDEASLLLEFDDVHNGEQGLPFTAWGVNWVYFPVIYDSTVWVGHVPRNPCEISTEHQGGS
jgi:hypothetical protein